YLFDLEDNFTDNVIRGSEVVIIGNSLGHGTLLETKGNVLGVGPLRVEHNAPTFKGNSGSPIILASTRKVIGIDTYSSTVDDGSFFTRQSLADGRSAIQGNQRLFGFRLDSVKRWQRVDLRKLEADANLLENFHQDSLALWTFMTKTTEG